MIPAVLREREFRLLWAGQTVSVIGDGILILPDLAPLDARCAGQLISSSVHAMRVLVTGGAGFIGSHFVRRLEAAGDEVVVLDKLTYAGNRENLADVSHEFHQGDIADHRAVENAAAGCDAIVNFAAETHVDRSISGPAEFIVTDVLGTQVLLDHVRQAEIHAFVQVSTDEVYGDRLRPAPPPAPRPPRSGRRAPTRRRRPAATCRCSPYGSAPYGVDAACITRGANNY